MCEFICLLLFSAVDTHTHTLTLLLGRPLIKPLRSLSSLHYQRVCVCASLPLTFTALSRALLDLFVLLYLQHLPSSHARATQALARNSFYFFCAPFYVLALLKSTRSQGIHLPTPHAHCTVVCSLGILIDILTHSRSLSLSPARSKLDDVKGLVSFCFFFYSYSLLFPL